MVLLTFNTKHKELKNGSKKQTIRLNIGYYPYWVRVKDRIWQKRINGIEEYLHIWWRNPRNKLPDCYKMGIAKFIDYDTKYGSELTYKDAKLDGFLTLEQLLTELGKRNKISLKEVLDNIWAIISFKWVEKYTDSA